MGSSKRRNHRPEREKSDWLDDEDEFTLYDQFYKVPGKRHSFSLDFLSKTQKQTIAAVLLFFIVLSAKYSGDPASTAVFHSFQAALSQQNDYTVALNQLVQSVFAGGGNSVAVNKSGPIAVLPLSGTVVNRFGWQVINGQRKYNRGIDIVAPLGTPVLSPLAGRVVNVARDTGYGRFVKIDHGNGLVSLLANFADVSVKTGQWVDKGEQLGTLGFTASYKRPWLHWELRRDNKEIDPESLDIQTDNKL